MIKTTTSAYLDYLCVFDNIYHYKKANAAIDLKFYAFVVKTALLMQHLLFIFFESRNIFCKKVLNPPLRNAALKPSNEMWLTDEKSLSKKNNEIGILQN